MTDNSDIPLKAKIRRMYLSKLKGPRVLDLFCGGGEMYRQAYETNNETYLGIDRKEIFDDAVCRRTDNLLFLSTADLTEYNFFDFDAYGSPWKQLLLFSRKTLPETFVVVFTDGSIMRWGRYGMTAEKRTPNLYLKVFNIKKDFRIPFTHRFYYEFLDSLLNLFFERIGRTPSTLHHTQSRSNSMIHYFAMHFTSPTVREE